MANNAVIDINTHVAPHSGTCHPESLKVHLNYTLVGRTESLSDDFGTLFATLGDDWAAAVDELLSNTRSESSTDRCRKDRKCASDYLPKLLAPSAEERRRRFYTNALQDLVATAYAADVAYGAF